MLIPARPSCFPDFSPSATLLAPDVLHRCFIERYSLLLGASSPTSLSTHHSSLIVHWCGVHEGLLAPPAVSGFSGLTAERPGIWRHLVASASAASVTSPPTLALWIDGHTLALAQEYVATGPCADPHARVRWPRAGSDGGQPPAGTSFGAATSKLLLALSARLDLDQWYSASTGSRLSASSLPWQQGALRFPAR